MKYLLTLSYLLCLPTLCNAQMEGKFYFPSKNFIPIEEPHKEFNFFIGKDTLNTILLTSKNKKPKTTFIYFHGAGGNVSKYVKYVEPLTGVGHQVLMIDLRGYGKSTGKLSHENAVSDAEFILTEIMKLKTFKKQKFVVYGASMGTQVAARFTERQQKFIKALVLDGCISSLTDIAADKSPENQREMIRTYLKFPYSAKESVKNIKIPILFIHSKDDADVPYSQAQIVFESANEPKSFWTYSGKHLEAPILLKEEFLSKIQEILRK